MVIDYKSKEFKGCIKIDVPNFKQRLRYVRDSGFEVGPKVELSKNIDALLKLIDIAEKHIKEIDIKVGKELIKSWASLLDSPSCDSIIQDLAGIMVNGFKLGEA